MPHEDHAALLYPRQNKCTPWHLSFTQKAFTDHARKAPLVSCKPRSRCAFACLDPHLNFGPRNAEHGKEGNKQKASSATRKKGHRPDKVSCFVCGRCVRWSRSAKRAQLHLSALTKAPLETRLMSLLNTWKSPLGDLQPDLTHCLQHRNYEFYFLPVIRTSLVPETSLLASC